MSEAEQALRVVHEPREVASVLPEIRRRILAELAEPDSAAGLARRLDLPRQTINYHLRELEKHGFVAVTGHRQRRGCTERCLRATAKSLVVDPNLLGDLAHDSAASEDRASSAYQVARAARIVEDVSKMRERAAQAAQLLVTLTLETEVAFASAADYRSFSEELAASIADLAAKYHRPNVARARPYRLVTAVHPSPAPSPRGARQEASPT